MKISEDVNGHAYAGHANRDRTVLLTKPKRSWSFSQRWASDEPRKHRPGMRLIGTGAVLLVLLGAGLLAVSYAAQYAYVLGERHQVTASLIEAGALDVGMIIFSLIALGLALAGLGSKVERGGIIACAVVSAVMNFAPAESGDWRSVLAWSMPPIFLAFVVDRVVSAVRRHVLGLEAAHSPWAAMSDPVIRTAKGMGIVALYSLRFVLAPPSTATGMRRVVLNATPLPEAPPRVDVTVAAPKAVSVAHAALPSMPEELSSARPFRTPRTGKTSRFLSLVTDRHGPLAQFPIAEVSKVSTELAPQAELDPGAARKALRAAVLAAQGGEDR